MVLLRKTLLNPCLSVRFVVPDIGCTSGVVLNNDYYKRSHTTSFDRMLNLLADYNPNTNVFEGAQSAEKQRWASKLTNQSIIRATKRGACEFILTIV